MPRQVLVKRVQGPGDDALLLDTATGRATPASPSPGTRGHGTFATIAGQLFALYADEGAVWLQWGERRWPLATTALRYEHDLDTETTTFSVDGHAFTYPAWWRGDPTFELLVPERDEHEDWLGYVMVVQAEPRLQANMLRDRG